MQRASQQRASPQLQELQLETSLYMVVEAAAEVVVVAVVSFVFRLGMWFCGCFRFYFNLWLGGQMLCQRLRSDGLLLFGLCASDGDLSWWDMSVACPKKVTQIITTIIILNLFIHFILKNLRLPFSKNVLDILLKIFEKTRFTIKIYFLFFIFKIKNKMKIFFNYF